MINERSTTTERSTRDENDVSPLRLTFIQVGDNCMFCSDPHGISYSTYVALEAKVGYISCSECREKMRAAVEYWLANKAYGKVRHLKDRTDLKVMRSSGEIDSGWTLNNPLVSFADDGRETIHCYNKDKDIGKWCYVDSVLAHNN